MGFGIAGDECCRLFGCEDDVAIPFAGDFEADGWLAVEAA